MLDLFGGLFGWMPPLLSTACVGVVAIFFIISFCHIIQFILDLIPFVR